MENYQFDLGEWLGRFPLATSEAERSEEPPLYHAQRITSPVHIGMNERLREVVKDKINWGPSVPVDVFIMAKGEPEDRHVTKIGGLPYRPAKARWPRDDNDDPMTFLAQFCFADSKDLTGDLPGDVLLVFRPPDEELSDDYEFEWYPLGLTDLVRRIPRGQMGIPPCYGYVCRTTSFPRAERKKKYGTFGDLECEGMVVRQDYLLRQYQATQIGRAPYYIQPEDEDAAEGRPLCVLNSVEPSPHAPYPWVNQARPLYPKNQTLYSDYHYLSFGDAGCLYISIDEAGRLHAHPSGY